jgi:hypothetical protein
VSKGIILIGRDDTIEGKASSSGLAVDCPSSIPQDKLPFDKNLIVQAGTRVPWDLLPAAWHFLERWDAAVPLWRYGVTAADVGSDQERRLTKKVVRDLRVLLHSTELVFVRRNQAGQELVSAWREEQKVGKNPRLAFLRAFYRVKPRLCVLPTSWMAEIRQRERQEAVAHRGRQSPNAGRPLVLVELGPGRFVKCHKGDEERVREHFARQRAAGRAGRGRR